MIDAAKFAKPTHLKPEGKFLRFGLDESAKIAAHLRELADLIERNVILPQNVQTGSVAKIYEYPMHGFYLEYAEWEEVAKKSYIVPERIIELP